MKNDQLQVRVSPPFKLKDRINNGVQIIKLQNQFGFIPEVIIIEKIKGQNNQIRVVAVLTDDELKRSQNLAATEIKK